MQVITNRGAGFVSFTASAEVLGVVRWISRRRAPFTLAELERVAKTMHPTDLESVIAVLVEHQAVQIDSRLDSQTQLD